jgi:hypothetical protein
LGDVLSFSLTAPLDPTLLTAPTVMLRASGARPAR